ncbi:tubulin polyglutamylase TTLL4-like protein [Dinothrombium tinctorium]|uniref:Tubulin polyglutamylase TTLL4-like protein n=1 Tax=Dinothrombium tinctorium TaxID=1965070 RepID=A0A3S3P398_9ACAR|nr:tubulin polyglutamylase TTLL4-like protein [Dinothrombium tinctorium]
MKCNDFAWLNQCQKVNHFPGSFHFGRKDKLWINLQCLATFCGDESLCSFHPKTYLLPHDLKELRKEWIANAGVNKLMILKPPAAARGNGITVIHKWSQIPKSVKQSKKINKAQLVVQEYISNPCLLFNRTKFDLRFYCLVTSFNPLRIYIFDDGLVRFASVKYSYDIENLNNQFMHLTNYSINKKSLTYKINDDAEAKTGHKWTLKTFWNYLKQSETNLDVEKLKSKIFDMILKTVIACESNVDKLVKKHSLHKYNSFELLGFDIMLDCEFKPWLLEVNISPSLRAESSLDASVKGQLIKDMLNIVGYKFPLLDDDEYVENQASHLHSDKSFLKFKFSKEEREKHKLYERSFCDENILENLTPDDVRQLMEAEDELSRCGHFIRVFPSASSDIYMNLFVEKKYYNLLLNEWEKKFGNDRMQGIAFLQSIAERKIHLKGVCIYENYDTDENSSNFGCDTILFD